MLDATDTSHTVYLWDTFRFFCFPDNYNFQKFKKNINHHLDHCSFLVHSLILPTKAFSFSFTLCNPLSSSSNIAFLGMKGYKGERNGRFSNKMQRILPHVHRRIFPKPKEKNVLTQIGLKIKQHTQ